jgi:hypothetical protein
MKGPNLNQFINKEWRKNTRAPLAVPKELLWDRRQRLAFLIEQEAIIRKAKEKKSWRLSDWPVVLYLFVTIVVPFFVIITIFLSYFYFFNIL